MRDYIISVTAMDDVWRNKQYMCAWEDFMYTLKVQWPFICTSLCVFIYPFMPH